MLGNGLQHARAAAFRAPRELGAGHRNDSLGLNSTAERDRTISMTSNPRFSAAC